ncbi:hypothetical protein WN944_016902 [Citrus x changshan-huyou]|uniref:Uncharacterized protein n=1 Tax=Citrus x changshan-huyou TaxID=2935761 RepID=A0AAP0QNA7_9ROSI
MTRILSSHCQPLIRFRLWWAQATWVRTESEPSVAEKFGIEGLEIYDWDGFRKLKQQQQGAGHAWYWFLEICLGYENVANANAIQ